MSNVLGGRNDHQNDLSFTMEVTEVVIGKY